MTLHDSSMRFEDTLDDCISAILAGREAVADCLSRYPAQREELEPLLRLSVRLQAGRSLQAPLEFRQAAAARMRNLIAAQPSRTIRSPHMALLGQEAEAGKARARHTWQFWRRSIFGTLGQFSTAAIIALILAMGLMLGAGTVYASASALPGDSLYSMKRLIEGMRLSVSFDDAEDIRLHLRFAGRRLDEAAALLAEDRSQNIVQALADYEAELGSTLALLRTTHGLPQAEQAELAHRLATETSRHATQLASLVDELPEVVRPSAQSALTAAHGGREQALDMIKGEPDQDRVSPISAPTLSATPTPSPKPPTATPTPEPPTPTPSPKPPTATPSPLPPTPTPSPKPPTPTVVRSQVDQVHTPTPTPIPSPAEPQWVQPPWWPAGCPALPDWPEGGWPPGCAPPSEWPELPGWIKEWPTPPDWLREWLSKWPAEQWPDHWPDQSPDQRLDEWLQNWPDEWSQNWPDEWSQDSPDEWSQDWPNPPDGGDLPDRGDWPDRGDSHDREHSHDWSD